MKFNSFFKTFLLGFVVVLFASCDKDFNEVGTDIIGEDHYLFDVDSTKSIIAYNQALGPVQTNNLPLNALGYYNHPVFGKTKASFVTQLELVAADPKFINPSSIVIDSVYLYVPYFSELIETNEDGDRIYELDSIYGEDKIKLEVYESNYFLRDFDVSTDLHEAQKYYSNQKPLFDASVGVLLNNSTNTAENTQFGFSPNEIKLEYTDEDGETVVKERLAPGMFLNLDKMFFRNKIIEAPSGSLINNNAFKNYFRGIYFKVDNASTSPNQGSLAMLNFKSGKIVMVYHDATSSTIPTVVRKQLTINLGGNSVNVFDTDNTPSSASYVAALTNNTPDTPSGDEKLYLRGQNGAMAVIELFDSAVDDRTYDVTTGLWTEVPNNIADEIDEIKANKWLINEANLTFYIERSDLFTSEYEPLRIYLYNLETNLPILDYSTDGSVNSNTKLNKSVYGGIIEREDLEDGGRGIKYKIRLTNYLRALIDDEDPIDNVKLGLVVTESISTVTIAALQTPITGDNDIKNVPVASVINPLGIVLHGSSDAVEEGKRLKLKIYYTKPD